MSCIYIYISYSAKRSIALFQYVGHNDGLPCSRLRVARENVSDLIGSTLVLRRSWRNVETFCHKPIYVFDICLI